MCGGGLYSLGANTRTPENSLAQRRPCVALQGARRQSSQVLGRISIPRGASARGRRQIVRKDFRTGSRAVWRGGDRADGGHAGSNRWPSCPLWPSSRFALCRHPFPALGCRVASRSPGQPSIFTMRFMRNAHGQASSGSRELRSRNSPNPGKREDRPDAASEAACRKAGPYWHLYRVPRSRRRGASCRLQE